MIASAITHNESGTDAVTPVPLCTFSGSWVSERISALVKASTRTSGNKVWTSLMVRTSLIGWLNRHLSAFGERLFKDADKAADQHGWQITRTQGGLGRTYRDPRFDSLHQCPACAGSGLTPGAVTPARTATARHNNTTRTARTARTYEAGTAPCRTCAGTGRITRQGPATPIEGGGSRA